jgi:hypothetical protein
MRLNSAACWLSAMLVLMTTACGLEGPAFGLGPAMDPLVGLLVFTGLILGGAWAVKSTLRSSIGPAINRWSSDTGQTSCDPFSAGDKTTTADQRRRTASSNAEEILRERYARGEIGREQYLETIKDLKSH